MRVNLFDPGFLADPYRTYAWMRENSPVHHLGGGYWALSRHEDVVNVLRNPGVFSSELGYEGMMGGGAATMPGADPEHRRAMTDSGMGLLTASFAGLRVLISVDPPDHTRLRRLVSKPLSPRSIWALEPRVREICNGLVDEMLAARIDGVADLWSHVSYPLPTMVIAEMLGMPSERKADFKRWSDALVNGMSLGGGGDMRQGATGAMQMFQYFNELIAERRAQPRDDLISLMVRDDAGGDDALSTPELIAFCVLLLIAGNETTTNLLGNFFEAMDRYPDELARLRREPDLINSAVEEALRYDSPVQGLWRGLREPTKINGVELPAGARVMTLFAAANHDRSQYGEDAEVFRSDRNPTDHVAFGTGIHVCLGAALARLEARVAISTILERTADLEKAGEPLRPLSPVLRGVRSQPLRLTAA